MGNIQDSMARQGLTRPFNDRWLGGVCGGVARRYGVDLALTRLLFVLVGLFIPGSTVVAYVVLLIVMPEDAPPMQEARPETSPEPPSTI